MFCLNLIGGIKTVPKQQTNEETRFRLCVSHFKSRTAFMTVCIRKSVLFDCTDSTWINTKELHKSVAEVCCPVGERKKKTHIHISSTSTKKRSFVSGEFLLQYRAVQPPPPLWGRSTTNGLHLLANTHHKLDWIASWTCVGWQWLPLKHY